MSVIGGLFSVPILAIISYVTGDGLNGFLDLMNKKDYSFMKTFFNDNYTNLSIVIILAFIYAVKPIFNTGFILSVPSILGYLTVDII